MALRFNLPKRRIGKRTKWPRPSKLLSKGKLDPRNRHHAWLRIEKDDVYVLVTDGVTAAQVRLATDDNRTQSIDGVPEGCLPAEALKDIETSKRPFSINPLSISLGRTTYEREPDWPGDKRQPQVSFPRKPKNALRLGFNAKRLHDLADALGTEEVALTINLDKPGNPIGVEAIANAEVVEGRKGVITQVWIPGE